MKKVIVYQAKDGSTHATPASCKAHDAKLAIKPAADAFVAGLGVASPFISTFDGVTRFSVHADDLADFIAGNADTLRKLLTEPLIIRKPRKAKKVLATSNPDVGSHA